MRILQISSAKNFGGGERHFVDLCRGLAEQGHDVSAAVRAQAVWLDQLSFLPAENIIYLPLRNSLDVFSGGKLAEEIRRRKIQIVHAHLAKDYAVAALAVRLAKNSRLVLTRHVFFPLNFLYKHILPRNTFFIAPTKAGKEKLVRQNILPAAQVRHIYYGIDTRHFAETSDATDRTERCKKLNLPAEKKFVGIAGEITRHKGQTDFVRAAAIVAEKFPDAEFLVIGQDSSPQKTHLQTLENLIAELNLSDKIHLLGFRADVATLYSLLDVFVSASRVEPFGLVIAEASVSNCAVAATETAGAGEIIIDGETGKLVAVKDFRAMAKAIGEFLSDDKMRADFAAKARRRIEENFSLEEMIKKTVQLYKNLLAQEI